MKGQTRVIYFTVGLKDPITKDPLVTPVRNLLCSAHDAFEENTLSTLLENSDDKIACPLCNAPITKDTLSVDYELLDFIETHQPSEDREVVFHLESNEYMFVEDIPKSQEESK